MQVTELANLAGRSNQLRSYETRFLPRLRRIGAGRSPIREASVRLRDSERINSITERYSLPRHAALHQGLVALPQASHEDPS